MHGPTAAAQRGGGAYEVADLRGGRLEEVPVVRTRAAIVAGDSSGTAEAARAVVFERLAGGLVVTGEVRRLGARGGLDEPHFNAAAAGGALGLVGTGGRYRHADLLAAAAVDPGDEVHGGEP